jgi:hypothetical protein
MRFLLFNLVVAGALFYLFTADRSDIHGVASTAHATVDQVEELTYTAVDTVNGFIEEKADFKAPVFDPLPPRMEIQPEIVAAPAPALVETPPSPVIAETPVVAESKGDGAAEESGTTDEATTKPVMVAAVDLPARDVAVLNVHPVPDPAEALARAAVTDPAVARRRAEVLGETAAVETPVPGKPEIAIAEGETLMSPKQRRKELYNLAQEMELLFLKNTVE